MQFEVYDAPQAERAMPRRLAAHLQIMADQGAERSLFSSCPECALHSAPSTWTDAFYEHAWRSPGPTPWWGPTFQVTTDENLFGTLAPWVPFLFFDFNSIRIEGAEDGGS